MVPGEGRLTAEVIRNNVVQRVEKFGLCVKTDCIMGTNDGCTTMEKYGRLLDKLIQFCLAHGFQLAVVKGIYILLTKPKPHNKRPNLILDLFFGICWWSIKRMKT